jgi:hypothetical protein
MAGILDPFTRHPASVGETYTEHLCMAGSFGWRMVIGGLACLVHAVFPFLFEYTASNHIRVLHEQMVQKRRRLDRLAAEAQPVALDPRGGATA